MREEEATAKEEEAHGRKRRSPQQQWLLCLSPSPESLATAAAAALTALKGITADLSIATDAASLYSKRSKIFILINCRSLCDSLQERTSSIDNWLALLDSDLLDLRKKIADLSRDMKQTQFTVTKNEERVHCTLQKEGQGRRTSKAVQSAIIMDLARALGIESDNYSKLLKQVKLFKDNLTRSNSISERKILVSLERPKCSPNILAEEYSTCSQSWTHLPTLSTNLCLDSTLSKRGCICCRLMLGQHEFMLGQLELSLFVFFFYPLFLYLQPISNPRKASQKPNKITPQKLTARIPKELSSNRSNHKPEPTTTRTTIIKHRLEIYSRRNSLHLLPVTKSMKKNRADGDIPHEVTQKSLNYGPLN
ncbi:hypothetical protein CMV_016880 [Castanea mollissima]|uniref:Uncharacterized protein n=1 Tax=Castanea mollissima TaxID=60419 RepID=A0A8J4QTF7_9ROSI|nr:hypothetical protein CMV_016880 [Castanea mollissima]